MEPLSTFDLLLQSTWEAPLQTVTPREVTVPSLPGKATALVGMRRVGKTSWMFGAMRARLAEGLPRERLVYVNFEDERLARLTLDGLRELPEAAYRLAPAEPGAERWFFLDEIQNVQGWERFVRRLVDAPGVRVVITGSSSKLLSAEVATSMRGRSLATEIAPFSFREALDFHGVARPVHLPPGEVERGHIERAFLRYVETGGFPEVQNVDARVRDAILRDYVDVVILRDVIERHGVSNVPVLRQLVRRLLGAPGGEFTVNRFVNDLKSQGIAASRESVHALMEHLADAFLVTPLHIASDSQRKRAANPSKVYPIDPALCVSSAITRSPNLGHALEVLVHAELRRRGYEVAWARTAAGAEIDFVARKRGAEPLLVQVCWDFSDPGTRARELRGFDEAAVEHEIRQGLVITTTATEDLSVGRCDVAIRPAWWWLLEPLT